MSRMRLRRVVLGGGPGGYASALYGASAGLKVALVEQDKVGGTCLQRGCIPAKALLHAAEVYRTVGHAGDYGFKLPEGTTAIDWPAVNKRKSGIVTQLTKGLAGLLKRRKVTVVNGHGRLTADGAVAVGDQTLTGRAVIVCTGSAPRLLPGHGARRRAGGHLRPRHQQRADHAAGAGRGHRRRRDRRRVRLRLHRPRLDHHAAGGAAARRAADRAGPGRRRHAGPGAEAARDEHPRRGPGRQRWSTPTAASWCRSRRRRRRQDRGRPGPHRDRPAAGHRGRRARRGRRPGLRPRLRRGRPDHDGHLAARASTPSATASTPPASRTSRTPRRWSRSRTILGEQPRAGRLREGAVGGLHAPGGRLGRAHRGRGAGGRLRRRGAQALDGRQRAGADHRRRR